MISTFEQRQSGEPLQLILGTDKRNPVLSVHAGRATGTLHVYYGFELMEILADERESPAYKLLIARLYNAGVKVEALRQAFCVDRCGCCFCLHPR